MYLGLFYLQKINSSYVSVSDKRSCALKTPFTSNDTRATNELNRVVVETGSKN